MKKLARGFSLMETLLAIVVTGIASMGVYALFHSAMSSYHLSDASSEVIEIANVYADLSSADLTTEVTSSETLVDVLQKSRQLPNKYFTSGESESNISNAFGKLSFSSVAPYGFTVVVPLGCVDEDSSVPKNFFNDVRDQYLCGSSASYSESCVQLDGCATTISLTFNVTG